MKFWISLFCINVLFFLPGYLLNIKNQLNPFSFLFNSSESLLDKIKYLYVRESSDPFRILLEFTAVVLIAKLMGFSDYWVVILLACIATSGFLITTYGSVMLYIFNRVPVIQSDLEFLKVGMTIAYKIKLLIVLGFGLLVIGLFYAFSFLSALLLSLNTSQVYIGIALVLILGLGLFNVRIFGYRLFQRRGVYSFLIHIFRNYANGKKYNFLLEKDKTFFEQYNVYKDIQLEKKPNIVIFSIESYGSIVLKESELEESIRPIYDKYENLLSDQGFSIRSGLSKPPQFGGGSWLSYTSFIFGMRVDDMNQYNLLFKSNSSFKYYQSLLSFLKSNGYKNYLLCPLGGGYNDKVDWEIVKRNFDADEFLDWKKMDYQGKKYKYLKMGYSPSDQYSIHKAHQIIEEDSVEPYSLFFSTLNSHMPFHSPSEIVEEWKDLNTTNENGVVEDDANLSLFDKYKKAINFQLSFVLDYINKKDNGDDTIYILFGDHQPPFITKREMGFSTPIHILSRNQEFLKIFDELSFNEGFYPQIQKDHLINHEGFYSLFMKGFNQAFGKVKNLDLPYMPNGVELR